MDKEDYKQYLEGFGLKWNGRSFKCLTTGEVVTIQNATPRQFVTVGDGFVDLGDGYYSRFGGKVVEVTEDLAKWKGIQETLESMSDSDIDTLDDLINIVRNERYANDAIADHFTVEQFGD